MIQQIVMPLLGGAIVVALLGGIWKCNARRWNRLAAVYRADCSEQNSLDPESEQLSYQTLILTGGAVGWNSYKGITTVGVSRDGIMLRPHTLFSIFHPPLLIPFGDLSIKAKRWRLFGQTYECTLSGVHNVRIIIDEGLLNWIESRTTQLVETSTAQHERDSSSDDVASVA